MNRVLRLAVLFLVVVTIPTAARIIHVPTEYPNIQSGINASSNGDTVLVHPGRYVEHVNFNERNIVLGSLYLTSGDTQYRSTSIIDGDSSGTVVTFESGEDSTTLLCGFTIQNGHVVGSGGGIRCTNNSNPVINNNIICANSASLRGGGILCEQSHPLLINNNIMNNFAVQGGGISFVHSFSQVINNNISENTSQHGGGIYVRMYSNPSITSNTITGNSATERGGGIYCDTQSYPRIIDNVITNNTGTWGGGIRLTDANADIINNIIDNNSADCGGGVSIGLSSAFLNNNSINSNSASWGGGIDIYASNPIITRNTISNNQANGTIENRGGGIYCGQESNASILNDVICNNHSNNFGGGICFSLGVNPSVVNCVVYDNYATYGGGIACQDNSYPLLINTILWEDSAQQGSEVYSSAGLPIIEYCDIQGGWEGNGNVNQDPLFRNPNSLDFHLSDTYCGNPENSPCIDAGNPNVLDDSLDCDWGLGTSRSDMGAYGGIDSMRVGIDIQRPIIPKKFNLAQNYPNPFNTMTILSYNLPVTTKVKLSIYNIIGQRVSTLFDGIQQAGEHRIPWDARNIASGIYFARLQSGEQVKTIKMVLLK